MVNGKGRDLCRRFEVREGEMVECGRFSILRKYLDFNIIKFLCEFCGYEFVFR